MPVLFDASMAFSRLAHAHASYVLQSVGVEHLVIKGPTLEGWLLEPGGRCSVDVDLLVPPSRIDAAVAALQSAGFRSTEVSMRPGEHVAHARTLVPHGQGLEIDVHDRLPGLADPEAAWIALAAEADTMRLGARAIPVPSVRARLVILLLTAARDGIKASHYTAAVELALERLDEEVWRSAAALARELGAEGALRAALDLSAEGRQRAEQLGITEGPSLVWQLWSQSHRGPVVQLARLLESPKRTWPSFLLNELLPSPAFMRSIDRRATKGPLALLCAYVRRFLQLLRLMPDNLRTLRALLRARRKGTLSASPWVQGAGRRVKSMKGQSTNSGDHL